MPSRDRARGRLPLLIALVLLPLLLAGVAGCGQKGPLYRADETPEDQESAD